MFERSLLELIRGIRRHKGNEEAFIQESLRECRTEIKSRDMDIKATALLKLIYLEMFGHDMSWASFQVLEVMSSTVPQHKRIGYLGAVQTFKPNTDVLMMATNQLKKDLSSSSIPVLSLPVLTIAHIANPSLSLSLLPDLLPRLTHSNVGVRKKAIASLYKQSLVNPDVMRLAWPRLSERLLDEEEDQSVVLATVNVLCELAHSHGNEILQLAPRLFGLLTDGRFTWVAIRILKMFTVLVRLELRLVKKLIKPMLSIITTTDAMSLLYECVNAIIQAGIISKIDNVQEADEIANLCVEKLTGLILMKEDANLQFVSLLAFLQILTSHPHLVYQHRQAIINCINNPDTSIRLRALDLVQHMVDAEILVEVVDLLLAQLRAQGSLANGMVPKFPTSPETANSLDSEGGTSSHGTGSDIPYLSMDDRLDLILRIVRICVKDNYQHVDDFEWLLRCLVDLLELIPASNYESKLSSGSSTVESNAAGLRDLVGAELRNVLVKVKEYREDGMVLIEDRLFHAADSTQFLSSPIVWVLGEYSAQLRRRSYIFDLLLRSQSEVQLPETLCTGIHALMKMFCHMTAEKVSTWTAESTSMFSLSAARLQDYLQGLTTHKDLEVQGCASQYLELMKLVCESLNDKNADKAECPRLIEVGLPPLFSGLELNAVSAEAQSKVPVPEHLDLHAPICSSLDLVMANPGRFYQDDAGGAIDLDFYTKKVSSEQLGIPMSSDPVSRSISPMTGQDSSHSKGRAVPTERNTDDPFFLSSSAFANSPAYDESLDDTIDLEAIPILTLPGDEGSIRPAVPPPKAKALLRRPKGRVAAEEDLPTLAPPHPAVSGVPTAQKEVDESAEDYEMRLALQEVERTRLRMQRDAERGALGEGVELEGTVVKKKKRKKKVTSVDLR